MSERSAMLLLALVLLLRCMLDTWDTGYYMLPFTIALLSWEVRGTRPLPILVLASTVPPWFVLEELSARGLVSPDVQAVLFMIWTVPLAAWLGVRLFARPRRVPLQISSVRTRTQEPTVGALGPLARSS